MTASKIVLGAASGAAGGGAVLDVDDVFSTHLYTGKGGTTATINNGIDLLNEGGLVWIKARNATEDHGLFDTVRGVTKYISSNNVNAEATNSGTLTNFYDNGFKVDGNGIVGSSTDPYVSWTFRKASKFFDIVTYTGDGSSGRLISHNLGSAPGMIIIKCTSDSGPAWSVFHRSLDSSAPEDYVCFLNTTAARSDGGNYWYSFEPTSTQFKVGGINDVNGNSKTYVAYLFAHNNNDGGFGPDSDQDIIKCGSFTDSSSGWSVDLGFEPQFLLTKRADSTGNWEIVDTMRGFTADRSYTRLYPNLTNTEQTVTKVGVNSTGFFSTTAMEANGATIIYMAIRRGPLAEPTAVDDVFEVDTVQASSGDQPAFKFDFVTDFIISRQVTATQDWLTNARLLGQNQLKLNTTDAESTNSAFNWDYMDGAWDPFSASPVFSAWGWKRAPSFCDISCFTGNGGGTRTISHHLQTAPKMLWLKRRDGSSPYGDWYVQHTGIAANQYLQLNASTGPVTSPDAWNSTYAAADVFTVGSDNNVNNYKYFVVLFGEIAGISKLGSYTGNGTSQTIDCGFSNGVRLVLVKQVGSGSWFLFDYGRSIVAGNDSLLQLNGSGGEYTGADYIDPHSSGFIAVGDSNNMNTNGETFIFYAIAA